MPDAQREPILYTQAGCRESARVRAWLTERGILFVEQNVSTDPADTAALAATGTFATPLLVIGTKTLLGFQPTVLASMFSSLPQSGRGPPGVSHDEIPVYDAFRFP